MRGIKLLSYCFLFIAIYLCSCTERFHPEIEITSSILVVDGKITNAEGPYEIRLFRTANLKAALALNPEINAIINIYDDKGNIDSFKEIKQGVYHNITPSFRGIIGRSYWIEILTSDGKKYESTAEMIPPDILIKNIYGEETKKIQDNGEYLKGVEFYLDAESASNQGNYLRWEYKESWEWHSPLYPYTSPHYPKTSDPTEICYPYFISRNISIFDGSRQDKKEFKHLTTSFINENEVKLKYNYLLNVSVYSTSFKNYQFWNNIRKSIDENGGVYDAIPANSEGNICACEDDDAVLGYFEASSVSTKNQIYSTADFEMEFSDSPKLCEPFVWIQKAETDTVNTDVYIINGNSWAGADGIYSMITRRLCYECNIVYSPSKPSFWP